MIAVPFLQPQYADPWDYVRFTERGLMALAEYVGLEVVEIKRAYHFGQTLAWLLWEYLQANPPTPLLRPAWKFLLKQMSVGKIFGNNSPKTHNTHYLVARKP